MLVEEKVLGNFKHKMKMIHQERFFGALFQVSNYSIYNIKIEVFMSIKKSDLTFEWYESKLQIIIY